MEMSKCMCVTELARVEVSLAPSFRFVFEPRRPFQELYPRNLVNQDGMSARSRLARENTVAETVCCRDVDLRSTVSDDLSATSYRPSGL